MDCDVWVKATAVGTIGAALAAAWAARSTQRSAKQTAKLIKIESARREDEIAARNVASVVASLQVTTKDFYAPPDGTPRSILDAYVSVVNRGPAIATTVSVELIATQSGSSSFFLVAGQLGGSARYDLAQPLYPYAEVRLPIRTVAGSVDPVEILCRWTDGAGTYAQAAFPWL